ncbi:MAG: PspA/IM30 family protein [Gammaproteobacteria bacterium]|nr:PspA/IM30 family protein [Gammaproteobacteria bacterium]
MNGFRRIVTTLTATFDDFVTKVENHEAIAESVVNEVRQAAAELKVQLTRVQRERARLTAERDTALKESTRWKARALKTDGADEQRALECMKRAQLAEAHAGTLDERAREHDALYAQLAEDLRAVESRIAELALRKSALTSRMKRAQVMGKLDEPKRERDAAAFFDRWETEVSREEYRQPPVAEPLDTFETSFRADEEGEALRAALDELRRTGHDDSPPKSQ